jgi:hypothetical protein
VLDVLVVLPGVVPLVLVEAIPVLLLPVSRVALLALSGLVCGSSGVVDVDVVPVLAMSVESVLRLRPPVEVENSDELVDGELLVATSLDCELAAVAEVEPVLGAGVADDGGDDAAPEVATAPAVEDSPVGKSDRSSDEVMLSVWPAVTSNLLNGTRNLPLSPAKSASASTNAIAVPFWRSMTMCSISPTS